MGMTPAHLASISDVDADPVTEEAVFIGTIALVLFLQYVTHRLDGVTRRHKHISDMINMMYREVSADGAGAAPARNRGAASHRSRRRSS